MAEFEYANWDGSQHFEPLPADNPFDHLSEYILEYGDEVLRQLERLDPEQADVLNRLIKEGYLEEDEEGRYAVSPKGVRRMQERALHDLFQIEKRDAMGKHDSDFRGEGQMIHEDSRPYHYGDPVAFLNMHETLKNAMVRQRGGTPLHVEEEDFVVHETEYQTRCATVLLLDMSGSMARYGKFQQAKRVALALHALIRSRYPEDSLKTIGFYTYASPLSERQLVRAAPKPVSIYDHRVFLRVSLDNPPSFVPEHFTNIQAGLQFARRTLQKEAARNKQIICITDGEPTAHVEGRNLVLIYPPSEKTSRATLEEARRCFDAGIRISTLALIEDYFYLGLKNFVDQLARLSQGIAVYCSAGELGHYVLDSFVRGRRSRKQVG
ncbi:MAG TPA: VWA domain-containing protein [Gemmataceae bacterium]|nr:VWA domain-containing protein [Gemmataceae bacterium]